MAKATHAPQRPRKKAGQTKQKLIPGTFDKIPAKLEKKVDEYVDVLRGRQAAQEEESVLRKAVIELMKEHNISRVPLDDEKVLLLEHGDDKVKIKKRAEAPPPETNGHAPVAEAATDEGEEEVEPAEESA